MVIDGDTSVVPNFSGLSSVPGANRVTNGTAWTGAAGATPPNGWAAAIPALYAIVNAGAPPYDVALEIRINATPAANGAASYSFPTQPGRRYVLNFAFLKGTAVAGEVYIGSTPGASDIYASGNLTNAAWVVRRKIFTATTAETTILLFNRGSLSGETVFFDTVLVQEIAGAISGDLQIDGQIKMSLLSFANNAAALAGGLLPGDIYLVSASDPRAIAMTF